MAVQHTFARAEGDFAKHCNFFEFRLGERVAGAPEPEHVVVWESVEAAASLLVEGSQRWALGLALGPALGRRSPPQIP